MLALRVSIHLTVSIMAGRMRLRQALILACGDLSPLCHRASSPVKACEREQKTKTKIELAFLTKRRQVAALQRVV